MGYALIGATGVGFVGLHTVHRFGGGEDITRFLLGILIPAAVSIGLLIAGFWLWTGGTAGPGVIRIGLWSLGGAMALGVVATIEILYELSVGVVMSDRLFVVAGQASIGSVVGFVVGFYDHRQRTARSRTELLSQQLSIVNRVLRHDIRNSANIILGRAAPFASASDGGGPAAEIRRQARRLVDLGDHARDMERMLRDPHVELEVFDVGPLLDATVDRVAESYPRAEFSLSTPDGTRILAHPLLGSALADVIENGVEHNDEPTPEIALVCRQLGDSGDGAVEIRIADNGPGLPAGQIAVLERGYETSLEHTHGLGLWLVNWIVDRSNGAVEFAENSPKGSVVCMRFEPAE